MNATRFQQLTTTHREAVEFFLSRARAIDEARWLVPRAEGKWTPAQETRHLVLTYKTFGADLRNERRMALKGTPWRRRIWRFLGWPSIKYAGRLPRAVRAPREVRPDAESTPRDALLLELMREVEAFERVFETAWRERPEATVTHAFFGQLSLADAITLAAVHTRHHGRFLPEASPV
jgi:hypothetical protein